MPEKNNKSSRNVHLGEYSCPCGFHYVKKGGNSQGAVKLIAKLHAKKCALSKATPVEVGIVSAWAVNGNTDLTTAIIE
tara:strand:+ start:1029 stop:1262 length:234 start_codon:yes stop_codon:yes gene_type:complete